MTTERALDYACLVGALFITCAGALACTGGDQSLALVLLTLGFAPFAVGVTHHELQLRLLPRLVVSTIWTLATPVSLMVANYLLITFEPAFAQMVLPATVKVLTGIMAAVTALLAVCLYLKHFVPVQSGLSA